MSLSYRIGEIEKAIPYQDVKATWAKQSRNAWVKNVFKESASAARLGELVQELLDAFTQNCVSYLWPDDAEGFTKMRETCIRVASGKSKTETATKDLKSVRFRNAPCDQ